MFWNRQRTCVTIFTMNTTASQQMIIKQVRKTVTQLANITYIAKEQNRKQTYDLFS